MERKFKTQNPTHRLVAKQESLLLIEELEKSSTTENKIHPEVVVSILERIKYLPFEGVPKMI